jgi:hypothetical protein
MSSHSIVRRSLRGALVSSALGLFISLSASAGDKVTLSGEQETPPVTTTATGTADIKVASDKKVSGAVKTTGVEGTAVHIHLGAAGEKGPPIVTLEKGDAGTWNIPEGTTLNDDQYAAYKTGKLYVNVHSAANKGGEIRGQLKP